MHPDLGAVSQRRDELRIGQIRCYHLQHTPLSTGIGTATMVRVSVLHHGTRISTGIGQIRCPPHPRRGFRTQEAPMMMSQNAGR
eukprot:1105417-Rhodomonas_salina.1